MKLNNNGIIVIPEGYSEDDKDKIEMIENIAEKINECIDNMVVDCEDKGILLDTPSILAAMCAISTYQIATGFSDKDLDMVEGITKKLFDTQNERSGNNIVHEMVACYSYLMQIEKEWIDNTKK